MNRRFHVLGSLLAVASLAVSSPAAAADKAPLSALPTLAAPRDRTDPPKDYGVTGLAVKEHDSAARSYLELVAATSRGYCIADTESGLRLEASTTYLEGRIELWRLAESDGKATFERTRFEVASYLKNTWMKSKTTIELREITRANGVAVWGFREANGDVVLLARGATGGREVRPNKPDEEAGFDFVSSGCSFGAVRLSTSASKAGALAQLQGALPPVGEGKSKVVPRFVVDGSLAKLSRDPEPVLAVRVRMVE